MLACRRRHEDLADRDVVVARFLSPVHQCVSRPDHLVDGLWAAIKNSSSHSEGDRPVGGLHRFGQLFQEIPQGSLGPGHIGLGKQQSELVATQPATGLSLARTLSRRTMATCTSRLSPTACPNRSFVVQLEFCLIPGVHARNWDQIGNTAQVHGSSISTSPSSIFNG